jgi:hypothetical protein
MLIQSVDTENRLFSIQQFLPDDLAKQILQLNWHNLSWHRGDQQENWARRQLDVINNKLFADFDEIVNQNKKYIEDKLQITFFDHPFTMWWYDEPGFTVPIHTDGHLPSSMQIYWCADTNNYGTTFFDYKNKNSVKYQCKFESNCGYLLLNKFNYDGSQPLQWHGMLEPVQKFRVSSYTNFGNYKKY